MNNRVVKFNHVILKIDAESDYKLVLDYLTSIGKECNVVVPKGKSWQKIEDATALMLATIPDFNLKLTKGISYYKSILTPFQFN